MKNQHKILTAVSLVPLLMSTEVFAAYSDTGRWSSVINLDLVPVAVANLPDGKVLAWSAKDKLNFGGTNGRTWTTVFDPQNETFSTTLVSETQHDMFCPGISNLPDGRIMASGGSGNDRASIYNPASGTWTATGRLNTPRGYQGQVTMTDGSAFTVGGSWSGGIGNKNAEVWTPRSGWVPFPLITSDATVRDGSEVEPRGEYRDDNHAWLWAAPNGKVFHAGPSSNMHWIDVKGLGGVTSAGSRGSDPYSMNGTTVMYDTGRILKVGGSQAYGSLDGTGRVQTIDIRTNNANVIERAGLKFPRTLHHSVVLPTGEVFVVGGMKTSKLFKDDDARLTPELWNPANNTWTNMSAMATPRTYHSTAILMNDGRVFVGGGGLCGSCSTNHPNVELFSPPYLYRAGTNTLATRPVINSAPATSNFNVNVNIRTNSAIAKFALVRASSSTHSVNNEQRRIPVTFTGSNNNYNVKMPTRRNAPPGNYMLFAINSAGTPSIAKTITLGQEYVAPELANGEYWLASPTSGQRLTAPSWNGFKSKMLDANIYNDQKWRVKYLGSRVYTLQNVGTGRYMEVQNSACANLVPISGSTSSNANNQRWVISKVGGNYQFRPVSCINKGLDREQNANNANGIIYNFIPNHAPQLWSVKSATTSPYPTAKTDNVDATTATNKTIDVLANDIGSGLTLTSTNAWTLEGGTASVSNNKILYKSKAGFTGLDKLWYVFKDSQGRTNSGLVNITVSGGGTNDFYPIARPDTYSTPRNTAKTLNILANDSTATGGIGIHVLYAWTALGGRTAKTANGQQVIYTPKNNFTGQDNFWYVMIDAQGRTNSAQVKINVQ